MSDNRPKIRQVNSNSRRFSRRFLLLGSGALAATATGLGFRVLSEDSESVGPEPTPVDPSPALTSERPEDSEESTPLPERTETPDQSPASTQTPTDELTDESQYFVNGLVTSDPHSHDFNANIFCGGETSLWSGLVSYGEGFTVESDWATHWQPYDNYHRWRFFLRPDNQGWSNGEPVTAHDFVWSWQRKLDPEIAAPDAWMLFDITNAREIHGGELDADELGVVAVDDWTLEIELVGARVMLPQMLASVSFLPGYQEAVEIDGNAWTEAGRIVTNGRYRLVEWDHSVRYQIERNPNHWDADSPDLDSVHVPILAESEVLSSYDRDQIDLARVSTDELEHVRQDTRYLAELTEAVQPATWLLLPGFTVEPFDHEAVRQAVAHMIDRRRLVQILKGRISDGESLLPESLPGSVQDSEVRRLQRFSVDRALELLETTPFSDPSAWPDVNLLCHDGDPLAIEIATDICQQLSENLGISAHPLVQASDEFELVLNEGTAHLALIRWDYYYADPHHGYADLFSSTERRVNWTAWIDENYDSLIDRAAEERDPELRAQFYREAEIQLQEQGVYIPIGYPVESLLIKPWLSGVRSIDATPTVMPGLLTANWISRLSVGGRP